MADENRPDGVLELWQTQMTEGYRMTTEEIRARIDKLERQKRRARLDLILVGVCIAGVFAWWLTVTTHDLQRIGAALSVLSGVWIVTWVRRMKPRDTPPADLGDTALVEHLRGELALRRDAALSPSLWWRVLLLAPGPFVFLAGIAAAYPNLAPFIYVQMFVSALVFASVVPINRRVAKSLQKQIDELDGLRKEA